MLQDVEDLVGRLWDEGEDGWFVGRTVPSIDVSETDAAVEAKVDLPGMKPDEIDIRLNANVLTVSGERKEEKEEKGKTYHRLERRAGTFSRSITLPCPVAEDEVAAEFHDGVLTITLPKTEQANARKIKVKS
jgi:HSP20 family protein